ncbi:MAG: hypothetical protein K2K12_02035 [Clostridia bacterium]|nr:hypothetical protein [Clostridia bacterium]
MFIKSTFKKYFKFLMQNGFSLKANRWNSEYTFEFRKDEKFITFHYDDYRESVYATIFSGEQECNILDCATFPENALTELKWKLQEAKCLHSLTAQLNVFSEFLKANLGAFISE